MIDSDEARDIVAAAITVLIVDDQLPFRIVARTVVRLLDGWRVVEEVATGEDAVEAARAFTPDVVLMDINLPGLNGIDATRRIIQFAPSVRVLLLSTYRVEDLPIDALHCGAVAYVRKEDLTPELLRGLIRAGDR